MIGIAHAPYHQRTDNAAAEAFETLLPTIERVAHYRFRRVPRWRRQELIGDVVGLAQVAFIRLVESGKAAFPTALANYAVRQIQDGRDVGCHQNSHDPLSPFAQRRRGFRALPMHEPDANGQWQELADGRRANPAEVAACRIDFGSWLGQLQKSKRQVALRLAVGETTTEAARHFRVSRTRISQLRRELRANWDEFQAVPAAA